MTPTMRKHVLDLMKRHKTMTIATVRGDGYPQATTVTWIMPKALATPIWCRLSYVLSAPKFCALERPRVGISRFGRLNQAASGSAAFRIALRCLRPDGRVSEE